MKKNERYLPEGSYSRQEEVQAALSSLEGLRRAQQTGQILEAVPLRCTATHDLLFDFGFAQGIMPRTECAMGITSGETREIAILTRVGKPTAFLATAIDDTVDPPLATLSRAALQEQASKTLLETVEPGDVLPALVTHLEPFGAFVDIGCGVASLIGIENLSVSRIVHPRDRLQIGQSIFAAVRSVDHERGRIALTHRELLGTWAQNAALFSAGETVRGIVRSVEPYGVFIELTPNLSGLAEQRGQLAPGVVVSVYIKSIYPARMKVKLSIVDVLAPTAPPEPPPYFIQEGHIDEWIYTPPCCDRKYIATVF